MRHRTQQDQYVLGTSQEEYERLRAQARVWDDVAGRAFDAVAIPVGGSCLDVGCGPGETMRLLARRVGPGGRVVGLDVDDGIGRQALAWLRSEGHSQCEFVAGDLLAESPPVQGPFDVVYARFLLFHLADKEAALSRLWSLVGPGGHLVVQDYVMLEPHDRDDDGPASVRECLTVVHEVFRRVGIDPRVGLRLPDLFRAAGIGEPDGTDVSSRVDPLRTVAGMLADLHRRLGPVAVALGLLAPERLELWPEEFDQDMRDHGDQTSMWPLVVSAWRTRPPGVEQVG